MNPRSLSGVKRAQFGAYVVAVAAFAGGLGYGILGFRTTVQTRTVKLPSAASVSSMSAQQIVAALGRPDQLQTRSGVTCAVWQSRRMEVCWR